ncbi:MAG: AAA family ATPase [Pseudomonadota bacterium]|nr:AAA family ATPase [Pseudomonadota bacterium]
MAKHLESLQIKNFRMLEDFNVEKLGDVNLIVGKNNSGKSTVLEALRIYAGNGNQRLLEEIAQSRSEKYRLTEDDDLREFPFESFFYGRELTPHVVISIGHSNEILSLRQGFLKEVVDEELGGRTVRFTRFESFWDIDAEFDANEAEVAIFSLRNDELLHRVRFRKRSILSSENQANSNFLSCSYVPTRSLSMEDLAKDWDSIVFSEYEDIVIEALSILESSLTNITFVQNKDVRKGSERVGILKLRGHKKPVPLGSLGDGMTRILQISLKMFAAKDGFLLIDEFENGLHYSVQEKVWQMIFEMSKKLNIQVFATTHSRDCIEAFTQVANDRTDVEGVLFRMGRSAKASDNGKIIATVFDEAKLKRFSDMDTDVR